MVKAPAKGNRRMGAHPWWYFVPYDADVGRALQALRDREFTAGRYNPVVPFLTFPLGPAAPSPGAKHKAIAKAVKASGEDGTRSILDMERIGDSPDFGVVCPLDASALQTLYGTDRPTRAMVEANLDFLEQVERGQGVYFVLYEQDQPRELCFAGYSYD